MTDISETLFTYVANGNWKSFFILLFNSYFPFGIFWWLVGFTVFIITHIKTKNLAFSGSVASFYFIIMSSSGLVTNAYSVLAMRYFGVMLGLIIGYYIYRAIRG